MSVKSTRPEIEALKRDIEKKSMITPRTRVDFLKLRELIFNRINDYISESTLERLWNYSSRTAENFSLRILNLLSQYAEDCDWEEYCRRLSLHRKSESDMFDVNGISTSELRPGDRVVIGWQPDRQCSVRYLGDNRFVAEETHNSKLQAGDTFSCLHFQLGHPLYCENLESANGSRSGKRYCAATVHGLSMLQLKQNI